MTIGQTFGQWLEGHHISQAAAARALGVSPPCIHDWIRENRVPNQRYREAIERWTGGAIVADAWLGKTDLEELARLRALAPYAGAAQQDDGA